MLSRPQPTTALQRNRRRLSSRHAVYLALMSTLAFAGALSMAASVRVAAASLPHIRHVWILMIENQSNAFGDGGYLAAKVKPQGAYIPGYFGIGHESADNYVALISGQGAQTDTQADCQVYQDIKPGGGPINNYGQDDARSGGCVYDSAAQTIADQLIAAGYTWKGYMGDLGADPSHENVSCDTAKSQATVGAADMTQNAEGPNDTKHDTNVDQYAMRHNPFMYFHSLIDNPTSCKAHIVPLTGLTADLNSVTTTPNYSFITPNLCDDGHDPSGAQSSQCAAGDVNGDTTGHMTAVGHFMAKYVPLIVNSPAFRQDGMLVITADEVNGNPSSPPSGSTADPTATACCNESLGVGGSTTNSPQPGIDGPGGGQVGAVVLSPFVKPGTTSGLTEYNHFSLLRTVEDIFHTSPGPGTDGNGHLGLAGTYGKTYPGPCNQPKSTDPCQADFGPDVFTDPTGQSHPDLGSGTGSLGGGGGSSGAGGGYQPAPSGTTGSSGGGGSYLATGGGGLISISPYGPAAAAAQQSVSGSPPSSTPGGANATRITSLLGPQLGTPGGFPFGLVLLILLPPILGIGGTYVLHRRKGS